MIRIEIVYSGRVQGVGFRYTTTSIARRFDVAGYVQNLPDGKVRLIAEGVRGQVLRLLDAVRNQMAGNITHELVNDAQATGEFGAPAQADTFVIRY